MDSTWKIAGHDASEQDGRCCCDRGETRHDGLPIVVERGDHLRQIAERVEQHNDGVVGGADGEDFARRFCESAELDCGRGPSRSSNLLDPSQGNHVSRADSARL
jgi:hypothetical protein